MKKMKWIYAKLNLAWALVLHMLFKRWFKKHGLKQFLENYKKDELFALTADERKNYFSLSNCIQCGFCVTACKVKDPIFYQKFMSPSQIAFSYSRSLPELGHNKDFLSYCQECKACETVCPTGVPFTDILNLIRRTAS